ncbi:MAG: membrane protein insertase YidC, partial [Gammaproteobacteria bacterium]
MDTVRLILMLSLAMAGMMLWQAWEQDYGQAPAQPAAVPAETGTGSQATGVPSLEEGELLEVTPASAVSLMDRDGRVTVRTDVLKLEIGLRGAGIRRAELQAYPVSLDRPDQPFVLMDDAGQEVYIMQAGLRSNGPAPTHEDLFHSDHTEYNLAPAADSLTVPMTWQSGGVSITKTYTLQRGSYEIVVKYEIRNDSGATWQGRSYAQIQRSDPGRTGRRLVYTYTGVVLSSPETRYEKIDFDELREQDQKRDIANGWLAMLQHYFVTALVPASSISIYRYYTNELSGDRFVAGLWSPAVTAEEGSAVTIEERIYIGPKIQEVLAAVADGLELTVDYGALWFIAKPLFWCLQRFHEITGNWGFAIILVTILVKLLFYHLSAAGFRSMANMRRVQPRMKALQERFKNDRTRLNQAMMQIYKEEKINPFGGCLPIVIQIPVFIALYWV